MIPTALGDTNLVHIEALITEPVYESRTLDFKIKLHDLSTDEGSTEALYDVIAFANTDGGDLIFGVAEKNERAEKILGVPSDEIKAFRDTLFARLKSAVEPPLATLEDCVVTLQDKSLCVYIIRVRASALSPHRARATCQFYERNPRGKNPMDIEAIRHAVLRQSFAFEQFDRFRKDRVQRLSSIRTLGIESLGTFPTACVHVAPYHAMTRRVRRIIDFADFNPHSRLTLPSGRTATESSYNAEGFRRIEAASEDRGGALIQIFRDGCLEIASGGENYERHRATFRIFIETELMTLVHCALLHMKMVDEHIGIMPCYIAFSFWGLKASTLGLPNDVLSHERGATQDPLFCHEVEIEALPENYRGLGKAICGSLASFYNVYNLAKASDRWLS